MKQILVILPLVVLSLLLAIWSGWIRIGVNLPGSIALAHHGSLMVNCFLATVIFLERAVNFRRNWILLLPLINVLSLLAFLFDLPSIGFGLNFLGSAGFLVMCGWYILKFTEHYYYVFFAGAFCLLTGNGLLLTSNFYPTAIVFWMLFLVFTIVAERLELTKFLPVNKTASLVLYCTLGLMLAAALIPFHNFGSYLLALSFVCTAIWLLRYDMARKTSRIKGHHRYSGILLLTGYVWLIVTGGILLIWDMVPFGYDALLHSFFLGFVFAMIFSHAPVILPAITKKPIRIYRPQLYYSFALMQLSLIARITADCIGNYEVRKISGLINGASLLLFFASVALIVATEMRKIKRVH